MSIRIFPSGLWETSLWEKKGFGKQGRESSPAIDIVRE
jgi:hypothetical protein